MIQFNISQQQSVFTTALILLGKSSDVKGFLKFVNKKIKVVILDCMIKTTTFFSEASFPGITKNVSSRSFV